MRKGVETTEEIIETGPCAQQGTHCHMKHGASFEHMLRKRRTSLSMAQPKNVLLLKKK